MINELIAYIVSFVSLSLFITNIFVNKNKVKQVSDINFYLNVENAMLQEELKTQMQNVENAKLLGDESFVRFLSESREWAFEYIEKVQQSLTIFKERVSKKAEYHIKFGNAIDSIHKESLDAFVEAYNELIELLPKEEEKTEEKK